MKLTKVVWYAVMVVLNQTAHLTMIFFIVMEENRPPAHTYGHHAGTYPRRAIDGK